MEPQLYTKGKSIADQIREGCIIADGNANVPGTPFYRGVFINGNFLLYRRVSKGDGYRGNNYPEDGYALAWADMIGEVMLNEWAPAFVPLQPED